MNGPLESFADNGRGVLNVETGQLQFRNGDHREFLRKWEIAPFILASNAPIGRRK
jgi:hypothetical protein